MVLTRAGICWADALCQLFSRMLKNGGRGGFIGLHFTVKETEVFTGVIVLSKKYMKTKVLSRNSLVVFGDTLPPFVCPFPNQQALGFQGLCSDWPWERLTSA